MKLKRIYPILIFSLFAIIATADILSDNGKAGNTGSPGENTCTNCHNSYSLNSGGGSITIGCTNMPNWEYIPGQVYHLTVTVARSANSLFGLGFEALKSPGNTPVGTFTITNTSTMTIKNATISSVSRPNVVHKLNGGAGSGSKTFSFDWTAPATNVGNIVFYAAGNACNNNGNESGDYVYTSTRTITPMNATGISQINSENNKLKVYPSPVKSEMTVEYELEQSSKVDISLYSIQGEKVITLMEEVQFGGSHIQNFSLGNSVKSGIYILRINAGEKLITKKLIVQSY